MSKKINKFWCFSELENERILRINGVVAEESWIGDEVTPKQFKDELESGNGDITVWIHSPGGDVFAAGQIYNMLKNYAGKVTVKIDGIAASAASVIAMSGDEILMSPVSLLMMHQPMTVAIGDADEMKKTISMLNEIKESIINAYAMKSGLTRNKISQMIDSGTWLNAQKAVELGFADGILYEQTLSEDEEPPDKIEALIFSRMAVTNKVLEKLKMKQKSQNLMPEAPAKANVESLYGRLNLLKRG